MAFIIAGHQRSGTSILAKLCHSHPAVTVTNEFGNFMALGEGVRPYTRFMLARWWSRRNYPFALRGGRGAPRPGAHMFRNLHFVLRYLWAVRRQGHTVVSGVTVDGALRRIFPDQLAVGDKHPDYAFQLGRFARREGVRCVVIIRDPRDVASSTVKMARTVWRQWYPPELREARRVAERWVRLAELWQEHEAEVLGIRYEELVTSPDQVLPRLGSWLGVDPAGFKHEMLSARSVGKHTTGLTEQEIADVVQVAGPMMRDLEYSF